MDWVTLGVIRIFLLLGKLLVAIFYYSLKFIIWILNKLRMTVVAVWIIGLFVSTEIEWCQNDWFYRIYLILGGIIFIISVFWLLGDIIRLVFPQFSFLKIPDYFSQKKERISLLTEETKWFNGLDSKKKIKHRYEELKKCFVNSDDINEREKLLHMEREYNSIIKNIGRNV